MCVEEFKGQCTRYVARVCTNTLDDVMASDKTTVLCSRIRHDTTGRAMEVSLNEMGVYRELIKHERD